MPQGQLAQVLRGLLGGKSERLLVGPESADDAGIVALLAADGLAADAPIALVQTVDYFPPVVDDPRTYGAIAAANALSDVYAMGGEPISVLNVAGFPSDFPLEWMRAIFRGGFETVHAAGAVVAGGHTTRSPEASYGLAVTGVVPRERIIDNAGARAGDVLYLTKSLGMGTLTTAAMKQAITWAELEPAARQMATLNRLAAEAMVAAGATACTDVTGFGLVGHARNVAAASGVTILIETPALPFFDGAVELARAGFLSGAARRGLEQLQGEVAIDAGLDETIVKLVFDAETSGGLLIVIPAERAALLERELAARDQLVRRVGSVIPQAGVAVRVA